MFSAASVHFNGFRGNSYPTPSNGNSAHSTVSCPISFEQTTFTITMVSLYLMVIAIASLLLSLLVLRPLQTTFEYFAVTGIFLFATHPTLATAKHLCQATTDGHMTLGEFRRAPTETLKRGTDVNSLQSWLVAATRVANSKCYRPSRFRNHWQHHGIAREWLAGYRHHVEMQSRTLRRRYKGPIHPPHDGHIQTNNQRYLDSFTHSTSI